MRSLSVSDPLNLTDAVSSSDAAKLLPTMQQIRRTIRRPELRRIVPLADTTVYEMEQRGEFPQRFHLSPRCVVWDLAEVEAWIEERKELSRAKLARVQTRSEPEGEYGGESDGGQEVGGQLVVAGGDAAEVLKPAKGVLDQMAIAVASLIVDDLGLASDPPRDHRDCPGLSQGVAERIGVVPLVGQDVAGPRSAGEQLGGDGHVGDVARREDQRERTADDVCEGVDLGRLAAARGADGLGFRPPFPPKAER
jgi:prophage regulatory protein